MKLNRLTEAIERADTQLAKAIDAKADALLLALAELAELLRAHVEDDGAHTGHGGNH